jgi:hypothetical protein
VRSLQRDLALSLVGLLRVGARNVTSSAAAPLADCQSPDSPGEVDDGAQQYAIAEQKRGDTEIGRRTGSIGSCIDAVV